MSRLEPGMIISPATAARIAGVTRLTIYRWIERGLLPRKHVGPQRIGILRADLERLLDGGQDAPHVRD